MLISNYKDLEKEYSRRMQDGLLVCRKCPANDEKPIVIRRSRVKLSRKHKLPAKWDLLNVPYGWSEEKCACGKIFPEIKYEEIEFV